jgi:hypothetical protein
VLGGQGLPDERKNQQQKRERLGELGEIHFGLNTPLGRSKQLTIILGDAFPATGFSTIASDPISIPLNTAEAADASERFGAAVQGWAGSAGSFWW